MVAGLVAPKSDQVATADRPCHAGRQAAHHAAQPAGVVLSAGANFRARPASGDAGRAPYLLPFWNLDYV